MKLFKAKNFLSLFRGEKVSPHPSFHVATLWLQKNWINQNRYQIIAITHMALPKNEFCYNFENQFHPV